MMLLRIAAIFAAAALAFPQGTKPRIQPSDYPIQATLEKGYTLAAEYLVHSIPTSAGVLIADDYLVVEVAFFGPVKSKLNLSSSNFALRINNQKSTIQPDSSGAVAASIRYPDWNQKRGITPSGGIGAGNAGVVYGPPVAPRFPGDPTGRPTVSSPVPDQTDPNVPAKQPDAPIEERVQSSALVEGNRAMPASGLIFFPYRGRTKSIKSLELIYESVDGKASLKLP
jgi:hypothetical protein